MSINARTNHNTAILTQQRMRWYFGAFTTTATTAEVDVSDFKGLTVALASYIGTPALADGPISVNETVANDRMAVPAGKTITVQRVAGSTSGQQFALLLIGA